MVRAQADGYYENAFGEIKAMLEGTQSLSFKRAVYLTENAYVDGRVNEYAFDKGISNLADLVRVWCMSNHLEDYAYKDSTSHLINAGIFQVMTDTVFMAPGVPLHYPFHYDFNDFFGKVDWRQMFVSKLLEDGSGNCHSLPYLYKILADELGTNAYLSFAPNHVYIKQHCDKAGWYNTELTSRAFPVDAWVMATGYVSTQAIANGIYMDTVSDRQSIAICLIDLAQGYQRKFPESTVDFSIKCAELALKYYPNYANGLLLLAESRKSQFESLQKKYGFTDPAEARAHPECEQVFQQMQKDYKNLFKLGYRQVSEKTYLAWLSELGNNKEKYQNKNISP